MSNLVENVKFAGEVVELQNMTLVLPLLNFGAFRNHGALKKLQTVIDGMKQLESGDTVELSDEVLDAAVDLVYLSAVRNYPEITKEQIMEGLDFDTLGKIIPLLLTKNKLDTVKQASSKNS